MAKMTLWMTVLLSVFLLAGTAGAASYTEAPMLAERVAAGELPPLEERLPVEPFVIGPGFLVAEDDLVWQTGRYGGTLRSATSVVDWHPDVFIGINEPLLRATGISQDNLSGNVVSDFTVSDDNTTFTFTIREGLRWSDGVYVTTEDVRFVFEDIYRNEEITPVFPPKFRSGFSPTGEPAVLTIYDDYTFSLSFDEPYGSFLTAISIKGWAGYQELMLPSHYLRDYHIDYVDLADLQPLIEAQEMEAWYQLFNDRRINHWDITRRRGVGFPALNPFLLQESPSGWMYFERNPYYFKVDTAGHQLPYIDQIIVEEVSDVEMVTMKVVAGEVDFLREDTALSSMPLYVGNEERGGYRTVPLEMHVDPTLLIINQTSSVATEEWREVVQDVRFREAINMSFDRAEIIDSIYFGLAHMPTWVPSEYDPDGARALLDEMGLDQVNADGWRLMPSGEMFELFLEVGGYAPDFMPVAELIVDYLQEIGLYAHFRQVSTELVGQKNAANELMGFIMWTHSPGWPWLWDDYLPNRGWGRAWQTWYNTAGESGEEPPAWVMELFEIHEEIVRAVPDTPAFEAVSARLADWYYTYIPVQLTVERATYPFIASARLGNIPHSGQAIGANSSMEQWYFLE